MMSKSGLKHLEQFLLQPQPQVTPEQQIPTAEDTIGEEVLTEEAYQQQLAELVQDQGTINGNQVPATGSEQGSGVPQQ